MLLYTEFRLVRVASFGTPRTKGTPQSLTEDELNALNKKMLMPLFFGKKTSVFFKGRYPHQATKHNAMQVLDK